MTKFSDQLFTDLMHEHSTALRATQLPGATRGHAAVKRGAWLAGGAGALTVGITAALAATGGGGAAAYAVTPHADGTVTVGISKPSGIADANRRLTALGDRVVVVPVRAGCPAMNSLPAPVDAAGAKGTITVSGSAKSADGSITVDAHGVPQGDVLVLAVTDTSHGTSIGAALTRAPAPSCVSEPPGGFPGPGSPAPGGGHRSGGGQGTFTSPRGGGGAGQPGTSSSR